MCECVCVYVLCIRVMLHTSLGYIYMFILVMYMYIVCTGCRHMHCAVVYSTLCIVTTVFVGHAQWISLKWSVMVHAHYMESLSLDFSVLVVNYPC